MGLDLTDRLKERSCAVAYNMNEELVYRALILERTCTCTFVLTKIKKVVRLCETRFIKGLGRTKTPLVGMHLLFKRIRIVLRKPAWKLVG